jgi:hypothetical protein
MFKIQSLSGDDHSSKLAAANAWVWLIFFLASFSVVGAAEKRPIDIIEDNSFLIEEAYNQEPGVVQHIFNAAYNNDSRRRGWDFSFTQEWPVFSQDHQFSYTIPSRHLKDGADRIYGIGDILLNYRYQALEEGDLLPAFAPRFSLILPTGNRDRGTGDGVVGYQWNLPFSKKTGVSLRHACKFWPYLSSWGAGAARRQHGAALTQTFAGLLQSWRQRDFRAFAALSPNVGMDWNFRGEHQRRW